MLETRGTALTCFHRSVLTAGSCPQPSQPAAGPPARCLRTASHGIAVRHPEGHHTRLAVRRRILPAAVRLHRVGMICRQEGAFADCLQAAPCRRRSGPGYRQEEGLWTWRRRDGRSKERMGESDCAAVSFNPDAEAESISANSFEKQHGMKGREEDEATLKQQAVET